METKGTAEKMDWVRGDFLSIEIPAHINALLAGGVDFLNSAMTAAGTLENGILVKRIVSHQMCLGGSTGQKAILELEYTRPANNMDSRVFVKFSRDFTDPIRDTAKYQLEAEVKLGLLSNSPDFPIAVPRCYFADYHLASGSGIIINQCIPFGQNGIEPLYEKCLDYTVPQRLAHYQVIIKNLAKLSGAQKTGNLASAEKLFPYVAEQQSYSAAIRYNEEQLRRRLRKIENFVMQFPQLFPHEYLNPTFFAVLHESLGDILVREVAIKDELGCNRGYIALMHWNANIDNAWFWRSDAGELCCGLMDWGGVTQMNIGLALWGALSAAESQFLHDNLDNFLALFIAEYSQAGGPLLELKKLRRHLIYSAVVMGLSWLMDAPALIQRDIADLNAVKDHFDEVFSASEGARTQLQMLCNFLNLWQLLIEDYQCCPAGQH